MGRIETVTTPESTAGRREMVSEPGIVESVQTLQELVERVGSVIGNPVTIEATDFHLLAYSRQADSIDEVRKQTILRKQVPEAVAQVLRKTGVVERLGTSNRPVRVASISSIGLSSRVAVAVRDKNRVLGHIWVQEAQRPLCDEDLPILQHAAELAACILLRIDQSVTTKEQIRSQFLWTILSCPVTDEATVRYRASEQGVVLPLPCQVLIVANDDTPFSHCGETPGAFLCRPPDEATRELLSIISDEAMRFSSRILLLTRDSFVIAVASHLFTKSRRESQEITLMRAIRDSACKAGYHVSVTAGNRCETVSDMRPAYMEACRTMEVARALGHTCFAITSRSIGALPVIPDLAIQYRSAIKTGLHEKFARLLQGETLTTSSFSTLKTLEAYLDCAGNSHLAAKTLSLHANTVNYRIRRIVEQSGIDLQDGVERLAIHLELKMRRFGPQTAQINGRGQ